MSNKKTTTKKNSAVEIKDESRKRDRLANLRKKNEEKSMIETKSGKLIPDFKLQNFEMQYDKELSVVRRDFKEINSIIYKNKTPKGENPIIEEAKDFVLKEYLGFEKIDDDADGIEKGLYYKAVKALFKALRDGEIASLEAELGE